MDGGILSGGWWLVPLGEGRVATERGCTFDVILKWIENVTCGMVVGLQKNMLVSHNVKCRV